MMYASGYDYSYLIQMGTTRITLTFP
jgi:hypothetical protein